MINNDLLHNMKLTYPPYFEPKLIEEIEGSKFLSAEKGFTLLNTGEDIFGIPLVISGKLLLVSEDESGKQLLLYEINPGESCILSITASLNHKPSEARAILSEDSEMIILDSRAVKDWVNKYEGFRKFIFELYQKRLSDLLHLVDAISFKNIDSRLEEYLHQKADKNLEINRTHQQIADSLGTAREVISRLLKEMENKKLIKLTRGKIILIH